MADELEHGLEQVRLWVWSGYHSAADIHDMIPDILDPGDTADTVHAAVEGEFARKAAAEAGWPATTDCDRLDAIFFGLHDAGICALANAGMTMSDGYSEVAEAVAQGPDGQYHGYCFYHGQDVARAIDGDGLMIAFGDLADRDEPGVAVGRHVADALSGGGFTIAWDGTLDQRIFLPGFDWKRRAPLPAGSDHAPDAPPDRRWWQVWR